MTWRLWLRIAQLVGRGLCDLALFPLVILAVIALFVAIVVGCFVYVLALVPVVIVKSFLRGYRESITP